MDCSELEFSVRYSETDQMGVANHGRYPDWFSEGRMHWLLQRGIRYADWEKKGIVLPVIDLQVRYRLSVRLQERLTLVTRLKEGSRRQLVFAYSLFRGQELCAEASTSHLFLIDGSVRRLSEDYASMLGLV